MKGLPFSDRQRRAQGKAPLAFSRSRTPLNREQRRAIAHAVAVAAEEKRKRLEAERRAKSEKAGHDREMRAQRIKTNRLIREANVASMAALADKRRADALARQERERARVFNTANTPMNVKPVTTTPTAP